MDAVPTDDRGLLLGDGLFETILAEAGRLDAFEAHAGRLAAGCGVLGLPAPDAARLRAAAEAALAAAGLQGERAAVRLTWTAGSGGRGLDRPADVAPRLLASAAPAPLPQGPAGLATVAIRRSPASPAARLKSLAYLDNVLARRAARGLGADEALILNTRGEVTGAAAANLFWIGQDRLFTPALECGVLDGTMRRQVLAAAAALGLEAVEAQAGPDVLMDAEGVFLTNSLIGLRAVGALDGRPFPVHPLVERLDRSRPATG